MIDTGTKNKKKRLISLIMIVIMVVSLTPSGFFASESGGGEPPDNTIVVDPCGDCEASPCTCNPVVAAFAKCGEEACDCAPADDDAAPCDECGEDTCDCDPVPEPCAECGEDTCDCDPVPEPCAECGEDTCDCDPVPGPCAECGEDTCDCDPIPGPCAECGEDTCDCDPVPGPCAECGEDTCDCDPVSEPCAECGEEACDCDLVLEPCAECGEEACDCDPAPELCAECGEDTCVCDPANIEPETISVTFTFLDPPKSPRQEMVMALLAIPPFGGNVTSLADGVEVTVYYTDNTPAILDGTGEPKAFVVGPDGSLTIDGLSPGTTYRFFASNLANGIRPLGWNQMVVGGLGGFFLDQEAAEDNFSITVELQGFTVNSIALTAQIALTSIPIPDVQITLQRLSDGEVVSSDVRHTASNGNTSWTNLFSAPGTTYRVIVLSPDPDYYLSFSSIRLMNGFAPSSYRYEAVSVTRGGQTTTHHQYTWEIDFQPIPIENINNSLDFVVNRGDINVTKINGPGVSTNPEDAPWIGIRAAGSNVIEWARVPQNGVVNFSSIGGASIGRHTVNFENGEPQSTAPIWYYIYEYAPVDSAPDGFNLVLDKHQYAGRLPANAPAGYELWRNDTAFSFNHNTNEFVKELEVTNNEFDLGHEENWTAAIGLAYRPRAREGNFFSWTGTKSIENLTQLPNGQYLLDRSALERGDAFQIEYQVEFQRASTPTHQTVLFIEHGNMSFGFDYRAAKGNNQITGTIHLERQINGVWTPAVGDGARADITRYLKDHGSLIPGTTWMNIDVGFNLRDDNFILGALYRVRFEGAFLFNSSGVFNVNDPGSYTRVNARTSAILTLVNDLTEDEIETGGLQENWRLISIADTLQIRPDAALVGVTNVKIDGNPVDHAFDAANKTLNIPNAGFGSRVVLTYTANFTDTSWGAAPCLDSYIITNSATATGITEGYTVSTNEVTARVDISKYSILNLTKLNQTGVNPATGTPVFAPGAGREFELHEYIGGAWVKIMSGTTDAYGRLTFSTSGAIKTLMNIPADIATKDIYNQIRLKPGTTYRIYEMNVPEGFVPTTNGTLWLQDEIGFFRAFTTGECGLETLEVRNVYQGRLTVEKEVRNPNGTPKATWPAGEEFEITVAGVAGTPTEGFVVTFILNAQNRSRELLNLIPGVYTVTERALRGQDVITNNYGVVITAGGNQIGNGGYVTVTGAELTASIVNTQRSGDLKVTKTGTGLGGNQFMISVSGVFADGFESPFRVFFGLGETPFGTFVEVPGVLAGQTYTVTEVGHNGTVLAHYTTVATGLEGLGDANTSGTVAVTVGTEHRVTFNNTRKAAPDLEISKAITGYQTGLEEFTVTVTGNFYSSPGVITSGYRSFQLKVGETWKVPDVVYGEVYTITETSGTGNNGADVSRYTTTINGTAGRTITLAPLTGNESVTVEIVNTHRTSGQDLTIRKALQGSTENDLEFTVQLKDSLDRYLTFTRSGAAYTFSGTTYNGDMPTARITITVNTPAMLKSLPLNVVLTVVEVGIPDGYALVSITNDGAIVVAGTPQTVIVTNKADDEATGMTVTKTGSGLGSDRFTIRVEGAFAAGHSSPFEATFGETATEGVYALGTPVEVPGVLAGQTYTVTEIGVGGANLANYNVTAPQGLVGFNAATASGTVTVAAGSTAAVVFNNERLYEYTIEYYKDSFDTPLFASETVRRQTLGAVVTITQAQRDAHLPIGYRFDSMIPASGTITITIAMSDNVIKVLYTARADLSYTIEYYRDSFENDLFASVAVLGQTFGTRVKITEAQRDRHLPAGYRFERMDPESGTITIAMSDNVIKVLYTARTDLSYTIEYYKDSFENDRFEYDTVGGQTFGSIVTISEEQRDAYLPTGYKFDSMDPANGTITIAVSDNVIKVLYTVRTDLTGVVEYRLANEFGGGKLLDDKPLAGLEFKTTHTEEYVNIPGFTVDETSKDLLVLIGINKIVFVYTPSISVEIKAHSSEHTYDGIQKTLGTDSYDVSGLAAGFSATAATSGAGRTNVGYEDNTVDSFTISYTTTINDEEQTYIIWTHESPGVEDYVKTEDGKLTINPRPISIEAASDRKVFDGAPLTNSGYSIAEGTTLAPDQVLLSVVVTGSQTAPGQSANVPSAAEIIDEAGNNVTANYAITYIDGELVVTALDGEDRIVITITANSGRFAFNNMPHTVGGILSEHWSDDNPEGAELNNVSVPDVTRTAQGNYPVPVVYDDWTVTLDGADVTENYILVTIDGTLEIYRTRVSTGPRITPDPGPGPGPGGDDTDISDIGDPNVPRAPFDDVNIPDPEDPLEEADIDDPAIPQDAGMPQTGIEDITILLLIVLGASLLSTTSLVIIIKKRNKAREGK